MTIRNRWYEVKNPDMNYGMLGTFDTESDALEKINSDYSIVLEHGYDNKSKKWIVVCVDYTRENGDDGKFLRDSTQRFVTATAEFSEEENKFVFTV